MLARYQYLGVVASLVGALSGCGNKMKTGTQMSAERMDEAREHAMEHLTDMSDNAALHDMSLADIHFVPHTGELSGTGEHRLDRLAPMLEHYGGTVHYETSETDKTQVDLRLAHVRDYLKLAGCDMGKVKVEVGLSGGRGTSADHAIKVAKRGTVKGGGGQGSGGGAGMPMQPTGGQSK